MLTDQQEKFAQNVASVMTQSDAYRSAYPKSKVKDKTVHEKASRLMANDKIQARVKELRDKVADEKIKSVKDRMIWLSSLIDNENVLKSDQLKASDQMNRIEGVYQTNIKAEVKVKRLEDIL